MSIEQNTARIIEESFRRVLAAAFAVQLSQDALRIDVQNQDLPPDLDKVKLPAIILSAIVKDWFLSVRVNGRYAESCDLRIQCRVSPTYEGSAREAELLATSVRRAIETDSNAFEDESGNPIFTYLYLDHAGLEAGFDHNARVLTVIYELTALPQG